MRYRKQTIKISRYTILGFLFTLAVGFLLHYVFEWTNQNRIVAFFVPVNESTWEHLKMIVIPFLLYAIFEYVVIGTSVTNFLIAKAVSLLTGMFLMLSLYYTYTGMIGKTYLIADIIIYVISVLIAYLISYSVLNRRLLHSGIFQPLGMILIIAVLLCILWFTYFPPRIPLFYDPLHKGYGF